VASVRRFCRDVHAQPEQQGDNHAHFGHCRRCVVTFLAARWFTPTSGRRIDWLVVHSMEMDERRDTAEACAAYFASCPEYRIINGRRFDARASAHECVDDNSRVGCVLDKDVAYAAPGANHNGLHLELAGRARQTRAEWLDDYGRRMLTGPAADWVAEKAQAYNIPLEYVNAAGLRAGQRGVTTHNEVRLAFGRTNHTDPGPGFPMDVLLAEARARLRPLNPEEDDVEFTDVKVKLDPKTGHGEAVVTGVGMDRALSATQLTNNEGWVYRVGLKEHGALAGAVVVVDVGSPIMAPITVPVRVAFNR
jgi:hypothetical protein